MARFLFWCSKSRCCGSHFFKSADRRRADKNYGERVTAFIVTNKGFEFDQVGLKTYLKSKLAAFKVPKVVITVDELPKNNAGKLLKRDIRKKYMKWKPLR